MLWWRERRALGEAGGARGVLDVDRVVAGQAFAAHLLDHGPVVARLVAQRGEQHRDARLVEDVLHLVGAVGRVDVHHDRADAGGGVLDEHPLRAVDRPDAHPVALGDPAGEQRAPTRRRPRRIGRTSSAARTVRRRAPHGRARRRRPGRGWRRWCRRSVKSRSFHARTTVRPSHHVTSSSSSSRHSSLTGSPPRGTRRPTPRPSPRAARSGGSCRRPSWAGRELQAADALVRGEDVRECSKSTFAVSGPGSQPSASTTYAFGHGEPQLVRRGHHGRLGDRLVLQQHALQLERGDLVVGGLEDVVGCGRRR
jgi:hypothetical protein